MHFRQEKEKNPETGARGSFFIGLNVHAERSPPTYLNLSPGRTRGVAGRSG